jgi:hypothetical protein
MKFCHAHDLPEDGLALRCRQSRLAGIVGFIVWCGILSLAPILGWRFDLPWLLWLGIALEVVLVPVLLKDVVARFRASNWVLQIGTDGVWVNLRSYRDKVSAAPSVMHLDFVEIASASSHAETYSTPSETKRPNTPGAIGGTTYWHAKFLEIQLNDAQITELKAALNSLRSQPASDQYPSPPMQVRKRPCPLWLVSPFVFRMAWVSGHGHLVVPRLTNVLNQLETYVQIAAPTRKDWPNWRDLTANQADELASELVNVYGDDFAATKLLIQVGGATQTEAWRLTQQFAEEGTKWPDCPDDRFTA